VCVCVLVCARKHVDGGAAAGGQMLTGFPPSSCLQRGCELLKSLSGYRMVPGLVFAPVRLLVTYTGGLNCPACVWGLPAVLSQISCLARHPSPTPGL